MSAPDSGLEESTRRAVLGAVGGALGLSAIGGASAHEWGSSSPTGNGDNPHSRPENIGETENAQNVGYHALGSAGPARPDPAAEAQDPHYGGITEIRTHGDYAYVGVFSSDAPTPGRGMVIVDISDYTRIPADASGSEQQRLLEQAQPSVVSYLRNNNTSLAIMDVKVSDDGQYAFLGTQPYAALFTEDENGEAADPTPNFDDHSTTASKGGVVAVAVSDKGNPQRVGALETFSTGIHNLFHHRIGGTDYVFLAKGIGWYSGDTGVYVVEFDRTTGALELRNRWTVEGNDRQGEVGDNSSGFAYCHDLEVQDDPITGKPTGYVAFLNAGFHVVDLSDPEDITHLAKFDMWQAHFATPAPTLIEGQDGEKKRICVVSHEEPSSDYDEGYTGKIAADSSGGVLLLDADGIYEHDGVLDLNAEDRHLDTWTWLSPQDVEGDVVTFANYTLSPHNSDFVKHVAPDTGDVSYWLHQAHYHGGVRFLELDTATWTFEEKGFSRPSYGVPDESMMQGLETVTPFCWAAVSANGVTIASDINQGVHAIKHDEIPIGGASPVSGVTRADDGFAFYGGQTDAIELTVDYTSERVLLRDRIPSSWDVVAGDRHTTYEEGGATVVEFTAGEETTATVGDGDTRRYFVDVGDASGTRTLGPVEVSADGGETWHAVPDTTDTNVVAGQGVATGTASFGAAAGAVGILASQRERLRERVAAFIEPDD